MDAVYQHLGVVEIDDQAAGVAFLKRRSYVDGNHVGVFGTSYGGYASIMCLLRHPEAFQAACGASSVTGLAQLRYDLYRALYGDAAGKRGGL